MTRRRSRWSTRRPLLAHRAELTHQGLELQVQRLGAVRILVDSFRMWLRPSSGSYSLQDFERSLPRDGENKGRHVELQTIEVSKTVRDSIEHCVPVFY